ncbi:MAG: hypothetical protein D6732_22335 [Methanobacteriota archaeon]|nr:MAG: hypothetical protein D6732_22335 [Euryarchaeota archaeon]
MTSKLLTSEIEITKMTYEIRASERNMPNLQPIIRTSEKNYLEFITFMKAFTGDIILEICQIL